jgi:uridylate kinase
MTDVMTLSLGGSIVAPDKVDTDFLRGFFALVGEHLGAFPQRRIILVVGGGSPAREYQKAYREIAVEPDNEAQDWIGVAATRLNAELVRAAAGRLCLDPVVIDPSAEISFTGRILVAAGWKPGFSSDNDAVILAKRFGGKTVVNLSNIAKVYTADPKKDPQAQPIDAISWTDFKKLVGSEWTPGKNVPFDPVATAQAAELGLTVICASGRDIANLSNILEGKSFTGTVIGPA